MKGKILLPNGCSSSTPSVNPKNWKTCNKSALNKDWRIQYYFYDPEFPKPKLVIVKGMNEYKEIVDRRNITQSLLNDEINALKIRGYNPNTKIFCAEVPETPLGPMNETLLIMDAFRKAHEKLKGSKDHLEQIGFSLNRFEKAAKKLRMTDINIGDFRRRQFKQILDYLDLTDNYYNKFRAYFSSLFVELVEYECCDTNLTRDIKKRSVTTKKREVLPIEKVDLIMEHLEEHHYSFYRYAKIFLYSGARSAELFSVQRKHIRLEQQEYDILLKKGKQYVWETKVIIQNAIPFWTEVVKLSQSPEEFIFSYDLVPGTNKNDANQITRRWRKLVKDRIVFKDGVIRFKSELDTSTDFIYERITADFYSLKHAFLDLLDEMDHNNVDSEFNTAQRIASHRSAKITNGVYTIGKVRRDNERLKKVKV